VKPNDVLFPWPRPRFVAGGGDALVWFEIAGEFSGELEVSRARHNSNGLPDGLEMISSTNDSRVGAGRSANFCANRIGKRSASLRPRRS
jgi:hypothetical protein